MREYTVPFSAADEERFLLDKTYRQWIIILLGCVTGLLVAFYIRFATQTVFLFALPAALPFAFAGWFASSLNIRKLDASISLEKYLVCRAAFKKRPRHYLLYRK